MIKAITFDFWDTLAIDGSDEPKRKLKGLSTKAQTHEQLFISEISGLHPQIKAQEIREAIYFANEKFKYSWLHLHKTPSVKERFQEIFLYLKISPTPGFDRIIDEIEMLEVHTPPEPVPQLKNTMAQISKKYRIGIISDTIFTPGRGIKELLNKWEILPFISVFAFSNEIGYSKPSPEIFKRAVQLLNCEFKQVVHVGDRELNDIIGPHQLGMKTILFTEIKDRGGNPTRANGQCSKFYELPQMIEQLI